MYWLIKSEPNVFSWQDMTRNHVEPWTGVRNYQARRNLIAMKLQDKVFFYHSNIDRKIMGIVEIVQENYPDPTADDCRWVAVDVKTSASLLYPVSLKDIKINPLFTNLALIRQPRLSVMPISAEHWDIILQMANNSVQKVTTPQIPD